MMAEYVMLSIEVLYKDNQLRCTRGRTYLYAAPAYDTCTVPRQIYAKFSELNLRIELLAPARPRAAPAPCMHGRPRPRARARCMTS